MDILMDIKMASENEIEFTPQTIPRKILIPIKMPTIEVITNVENDSSPKTIPSKKDAPPRKPSWDEMMRSSLGAAETNTNHIGKRKNKPKRKRKSKLSEEIIEETNLSSPGSQHEESSEKISKASNPNKLKRKIARETLIRRVSEEINSDTREELSEDTDMDDIVPDVVEDITDIKEEIVEMEDIPNMVIIKEELVEEITEIKEELLEDNTIEVKSEVTEEEQHVELENVSCGNDSYKYVRIDENNDCRSQEKEKEVPNISIDTPNIVGQNNTTIQPNFIEKQTLSEPSFTRMMNPTDVYFAESGNTSSYRPNSPPAELAVKTRKKDNESQVVTHKCLICTEVVSEKSNNDDLVLFQNVYQHYKIHKDQLTEVFYIDPELAKYSNKIWCNLCKVYLNVWIFHEHLQMHMDFNQKSFKNVYLDGDNIVRLSETIIRLNKIPSIGGNIQSNNSSVVVMPKERTPKRKQSPIPEPSDSDISSKILLLETNLEVVSKSYGKEVVSKTYGKEVVSKTHGKEVVSKTHEKEVVSKTYEKSRTYDTPYVKIYFCDICKIAIHTKPLLDKHMETHQIYCKFCNDPFQTEKLLKDHQDLHHRRQVYKYPCNTCNVQFQSKKLLQNHKDHLCTGRAQGRIYQLPEMSQLPEVTFQCNVCHVLFKTKDSLNLHMVTHIHQQRQQNNAAAAEKCKLCHISFEIPSQLEDHLRSVHFPEGIKCAFCPMKFVSVPVLGEHLRLIHNFSPSGLPKPAPAPSSPSMILSPPAMVTINSNAMPPTNCIPVEETIGEFVSTSSFSHDISEVEVKIEDEVAVQFEDEVKIEIEDIKTEVDDFSFDQSDSSLSIINQPVSIGEFVDTVKQEIPTILPIMEQDETVESVNSSFSPNTPNTLPKPLLVDNTLPEGWHRTVSQRKSGRYDVFIIGPNQRKFVSRKKIKEFFEKTGETTLNADDFDFTVLGRNNPSWVAPIPNKKVIKPKPPNSRRKLQPMKRKQDSTKFSNLISKSPDNGESSQNDDFLSI